MLCAFLGVERNRMKQALETMLQMQHRMNSRVHPEWMQQGYAWYRAIWVECAEMMEHHGYKWWKHHAPDTAQVQLELIDIWHFGLSDLLMRSASLEGLAAELARRIAAYTYTSRDVPAAIEALAENTLAQGAFPLEPFLDLMAAVDLEFDAVYRAYVGKNTLNFFRQDNGYKEGSYQKTWAGREDNVHLVEIVEALDSTAPDFADHVYRDLTARYEAARR